MRPAHFIEKVQSHRASRLLEVVDGPIQRIEIAVGQQRRDDPSYTLDNFEFSRAIPFQRLRADVKAEVKIPIDM